jgi:membrane protein required for colicin V production
MTWVDFAVLGVIAVSALLAFMRGFVREVLGIGAWVGAGFAAAGGLPLARPWFQRWLGASPWADPITFAAIFVVALIVLMLIAHVIGRVVRGSPLGGLDRTFGLVFGLVRGAALVVVAYLVAGMVVPPGDWPEPIQHALLQPIVCQAATKAVQQLPDDMGQVGKYTYRPNISGCGLGRQTSAEALLRATPQGSPLGRPAAAPAARY